MSDHETLAGIPAYIAGLSEFVRAHYERRMEYIEEQAMEIHDRMSAIQAQLASIKTRPLSSSQQFYTATLIEIAAALEQAQPYVKTAAILYQRAEEVANEFTRRTFLQSKDDHEAVKAPETDQKPDLQAGDPPPVGR